MACLRHNLLVLGIVLAVAGGAAHTATAAPLGVIAVADDDNPTDAPTDVPTDEMPMPSDEVPTDDVATATPTVSPTATPTATPSPIPTATATPTVNPVTIQQVIQHSNDEQVQAIATRNLSLITDTLTADHLPDVTKTLQDMLNSQVTAIALLKLDFGPITVAANGTGATATTYETWRIVSQAGSIDYDPVRNEYTLVLDNGTWKIKSDVQIITPPQATGNAVSFLL